MRNGKNMSYKEEKNVIVEERKDSKRFMDRRIKIKKMVGGDVSED